MTHKKHFDIIDVMKKQIINIGHQLGQNHFTIGTSGNISVKCKDGFLISASGTKLSQLCEEDIVLTDFDGNLIEGNKKPSSEKNLHSAIYKLRPDFGAIIHSHAPKTATLAACHIAMDKKLLADCVFYFKEIPLAPYAMPSSDELVQNTAPFFKNHNAVLMANHGLIVAADTLQNALYLVELAEFNAEVYINSMLLKSGHPLDTKAIEDIQKLVH